jgi:drug/metabolite transporter (DMT)-like permease
MKHFYYAVTWIWLIAFESLAQITSKLAADSLNDQAASAWFIAFLTTPWLWMSVLSDIISFLIWIAILRTHELSFAFLASSFCYVLVILSGWMFFHETLTLLQITGSAFIIFGIVFLSKMDAAEE